MPILPQKRPRAGCRWPRPAQIAALSTLITALLALTALAGSQPASAQDIAGLSSKADQARQRAQGLATEIEAQTGALLAQREQAASASSREQELAATLASGRERAAELAAEVGQARERLREKRAEARRSVAALADRLVVIYKEGGPDAIELLLRSDGFDDLSTRAEYLERIREADEALITRARDLRAQVAEEVELIAASREQQEEENARLLAAREEIAAVKAHAEARTAALASGLSSREAALGELRSQIDRWERQVQQAEQISAAEAEQRVATETEGWAIPEQIVNCESGGDFSALNPSSGAGGAYQILPSTWKSYGGKGLPHEASPEEQARIAALIWADSGSSAWECAG